MYSCNSFPNWLLTKYNLKNEELTLLDSTTKEYAKMKVPCCKTCNSGYWSTLEEIIKNAVEEGVQAVRGIDRDSLYIWLVKIYFGTLVRESRTNSDFDQNKKIVNKNLFESIGFYQKLMKVKMSGGNIFTRNYSIFVFDCYVHSNNFDYHDNLLRDTIMIRMGNICILACLNDQNFFESNPLYKQFDGMKLHVFQVYEIHAHFLYYLSISKSNHIQEFTFLEEENLFNFNWHGMGRDIVSEFNPKEYTRYRWEFLRLKFKVQPFEVFYKSDNEFYSTVFGPGRTAFQLAKDEIPHLLI